MGHSLCVLAAGLLIGQAEEIVTQPTRPGCNCNRSAASGGTQSRTWSTTGTWTQTTGTWTPQTGWTYRTTTSNGPVPSSGSWIEDRPILSRIFGRGQDSRGGTSSGWQPVDGAANGSSVFQTDEPPVTQQPVTQQMPIVRQVPVRKITMNEPPLLDVIAEPVGPQLTGPQLAPPTAVKAASFEPARVVALPVKIGHESDYSWITGKLVIENGVPIVEYGDAADRFGGRMILSGDMDISHLRTGDLVTVRGTVLQGRTISIYRAQSIDLVERK